MILKKMSLLALGVTLLIGVASLHAESSPADVNIVIENFAFSPAMITVPVGTTIGWTNNQPYAMHTVTSTTGLFDSGNLDQGQSFQFTFNTPGIYDYFCRNHPFMTARVIVTKQPNQAPMSLDLHAGWNMISSPVGAVPLSSLQGNCSITGGPWFYDGVTPPSGYSQPSTIESGKGYWVKVANACTMQASGSHVSQPMTLRSGWNMVSSSGSWNQMNTGGCTLTGGPFFYDGVTPPSGYQTLTPDTPMNSFQGYWIKVDRSCGVTSQGLGSHSSWDDAPLPPGPPTRSAGGFWAGLLQRLGLQPPMAMAPPLALQEIRVTRAQAGRIELQIQGTGIVSSELRLYSLAGERIAQAQGTGSTLRMAALGRDGHPLANGVYLYLVMVRGLDRSVLHREVKKLVLLR
jgi:plastocyanin